MSYSRLCEYPKEENFMNDITANILVALILAAFGFLMGSIPNGVLIGRIFFNDDPRKYGSHNSGGTNSGRVFGKKVGIAVILLDMLKTLIVFWVPWAILRFSGIRNSFTLWDDGVFYNYLGLLFAAVGHCYSPWIKFKGGKAVSCYMAATGGLGWLNFSLCLAFFVAFFKKKHVMSAATIKTSIIVSAAQWVLFIIRLLIPADSQYIMDYFMFNFGFGGGVFYGWEQALISTLICLILIIRHSQNIKRLREGSEKPVEWK